MRLLTIAALLLAFGCASPRPLNPAISRVTLAVNGAQIWMEVCGISEGKGHCTRSVQLDGADKSKAVEFINDVPAPKFP